MILSGVTLCDNRWRLKAVLVTKSCFLDVAEVLGVSGSYIGITVLTEK